MSPEHETSFDFALTLRKSEWSDDWWIIERRDHDGEEWIEENENGGASFRSSSRFSDADVEGTAWEMLQIAKAIDEKDILAHKRCAVDARPGGAVHFWSPRNSRCNGTVLRVHAEELADEIYETLLGVL